MFFGDYMVRKANPKLYDEIQDVEGLREVICVLKKKTLFSPKTFYCISVQFSLV